MFRLKHYIGDGIMCVLLAGLLLCASLFPVLGKHDNGKVRIMLNGEEIAVYDLSDSASLDVEGVQIKISDGRAYICESDCPDKVCTTMYGVDKNGGGAVCIPNKLVLEPVDGNASSDAVAG